MAPAPRRFWILAYPDLPKPVGGIKQMHRVGEAIQACGHEVVLVQDDAGFHPGWFQSALPTIDRKSWMQRTDLVPERDVLIWRAPLCRYSPASGLVPRPCSIKAEAHLWAEGFTVTNSRSA